MNDLVYRASRFAAEKHANQVRKYTGEPYFNHLKEVAEIVASVGMGNHSQAAAYLHDVIEDQNVTREELAETFDPWTATIVWYLTDQSRPEDGNRSVRKEIDRLHVASGPPVVHSVKVADLISNTRTIVQYDPGFARIYLREKELLLNLLTGAHPALRKRAWSMLEEARNEL